MFESSSDIPEVEAHDPEPVAVAIETARALFRSGEALDGLRWLRRAAERAEESGDDLRAVHLARSAADLSTALQSVIPSAGNASHPPSVAPPSVAPPPAPPPAPSIAPHPIVPLAHSAPPGAATHVAQTASQATDVSESVAPAEAPATTPSAPIPPSVPAPATRRNDEAIALSPYDDFSDKTIVDAASPPVGRDALQSGVQITELPLALGIEPPRSITMPSPPSSSPGLKAVLSPLSSPAQSARRSALRVAVMRNPERPGSWLALPLSEGSAVPEGCEEALLVSLQASSALLE